MAVESTGSLAVQDVLDVALIGGGIMSATLGAMLGRLQPDWSVALFERLDRPAAESSDAWNNAGTGHSGFCELNYMPDPGDPAKAAEIARQFRLSREFWNTLGDQGFVTATPHLDVVFGARDVAYLRARYETLTRLPAFRAMEYSEDPELIVQWAPLLMDGRECGEPMAATRFEGGTDVDFGALTRMLVDGMHEVGAQVHLGHAVIGLRKDDGLWVLTVRDRKTRRRWIV